jgi:hypothetical protein
MRESPPTDERFKVRAKRTRPEKFFGAGKMPASSLESTFPTAASFGTWHWHDAIAGQIPPDGLPTWQPSGRAKSLVFER